MNSGLRADPGAVPMFLKYTNSLRADPGRRPHCASCPGALPALRELPRGTARTARVAPEQVPGSRVPVRCLEFNKRLNSVTKGIILYFY